MNGLISFYIAATIFGGGVTLIDLFGVLGHAIGHGGGDSAAHDGGTGHDPADSGGDHAGGDTSGHGGDFGAGHGATGHAGDAAGGHDLADYGGGHASDHGGDYGASHGGDQAAGDSGAHDAAHEVGHHAVEQHTSVVGHHEQRTPLFLGIRALTALRTLVYFAFGFGPMGWIALGGGSSVLASLLWSVPTGLLFAAGGLAIRRIQGSVLDSQVRDDELYMEPAEVIVPIEAGRLGKVRAVLNGLYVERFAMAQEPNRSFKRGEAVRIVQVAEEYVVVIAEE